MSNKDFANNMASVNAVTTTIKNNIFYNTYRVQKIAGNTKRQLVIIIFILTEGKMSVVWIILTRLTELKKIHSLSVL